MLRVLVCWFHKLVGIVTLAEAAFLVEHGHLGACMHHAGPAWSEADLTAGRCVTWFQSESPKKEETARTGQTRSPAYSRSSN